MGRRNCGLHVLTLRIQVEHLHRPVHHRRHVRGRMVPVSQGRKPSVSVTDVSGDSVSPQGVSCSCLVLTGAGLQALAIIPHSRIRLLLSDVGTHVSGPTTPLDRAEAIRPEREVCARVGRVGSGSWRSNREGVRRDRELYKQLFIIHHIAGVGGIIGPTPRSFLDCVQL